MKVLLVTPSYYPIVGGSETAVQILSTKLNEIGIQADVMTFNMNCKWNMIWREETEDNGVFKIFRIPALNPASFFWINPLNLLKMYVIPNLNFTKRFSEYDIIHFQGEADISFLFFSFFIRKPKIFTSHSNYAKSPRLQGLYKLIFPRLADLYIAHERELLSNLGVPESKTLVWNSFGVGVEAIRPDETKRVDNLILFVGRITKSKGLHVLLEAMPHVVFDSQLVIIGPENDAKYAKECMDKIEEVTRNTGHHVTYLGAIDHKSLVPWYQKATMFVRPDLDGYSGGLTTLEAMSCGTPVIGTGNHIVHNGINGIVVQPNNAKELAKAINELLRNKKLRKKYGSEGRKMVEKQFSWEKIVSELGKIYESWLSQYQKC